MAKARTLVLNTKVNVTGADQLRGLGRTLQRTGGLLTAGLTLPLVGVGAAMLTAAQDAEKAQAKLTNVFDSMGAAAFTSVKALNAHAEALQNATTFDDESINEAQAVLLTFGNVTGDAFTRATEAALDLSSLFEGDLQAATIQIGKALNDPIKGLTALSKVGVSFTQQQKDQIKALQESGDLLGAQTIILAELERQFGGTAEALAGTGGGQMTQALNQLGEASEEFGKAIVPVLLDVAKGLKGFAKWLQQLNPETKEWVLRIGLLAAALGPVLIVVGTLVRTGVALSKAYRFLFVAKAVTELSRFGRALTTAGTAARTFASLALGPLGIAVAAFTAGFATDFLGMRTRFEKDMGDIGGFLGDAGDAFRDFFGIEHKGTAEMSETAKEGWAAYQDAMDARIPGIVQSVEEVGEAFEIIPEKTAEELAEARAEAVAGMAAIMDALNNSLRDGKEGYEQSWEDYLEGQKDPFTTAQRNTFIAGQFIGSTFDDALHSDDPEHVANTVDYVNAQLAEFNLMNPGVLAIGQGVPTNLQAGMEEIMPELNEYVKGITGDTLDNLSLEEAEQLGLEGIFMYAEGMKINELLATDQAEDIAIAAARELWIDASPGGKSIIATWIAGMVSGWDKGINTVDWITNEAGRRLGQSLPTEGPLAGGVGSGGGSIIDSWFDGMLGAFGAGLTQVEGAIGDVGGAMGRDFGFGKLSGLAAVPAGMGGGTTNIYNNFTFSGTPSGSPNELSSLLRDLSAVSGGDVRYG